MTSLTCDCLSIIRSADGIECDWVWLATDCLSIISTTLGTGVPPTALHDTDKCWPSVPNNLFSGVMLSMLKLVGDTVK